MKNFTLNALALVSLASIGMAASAFADTDYVGTTVFNNPNGCVAHEAVVDPECPGYEVEARCDAAQAVLENLGKVAPALQLSAECNELRGDFWDNLVNDALGGWSYEGFTLKATVTSSDNQERLNPSAIQANVQAPDAQSCSDAAEVLSKMTQDGLKVTAICDANELKTEFQF
jgi:hypothetical protein